MSKQPEEVSERDHSDKPTKSSGATRRDLIRNSPLALAVGPIAVPSLLASLAGQARADATPASVKLAPRYYPLASFNPEIDLRGKLAVITGASRGLGRAVGEALAALGVDVIGTSRNPVRVPNPPAFQLLALDIANPLSVLAFAKALQSNPRFLRHGRVDILANSAGRVVLGEIIPSPPTDFAFYLAQRQLGLQTVYFGHVMMTNVMLPLMPQQGYSRIIFTVSIASYLTGATVPSESGEDAYTSAKAALRGYANNLDTVLRTGGSSIRVSTVNPYFMNTALAEHPNPIYTQPVNNIGLSDTDQAFNEGVIGLRGLLANGLPPHLVGETYAQLLRMADPERNVVVASPHEPFATEGGNAFLESQFFAENDISAVPFVSG
jgi:NAD(P)-dependent dehydrogenase (short-subunit alcohol dehydrogenase family)